MQHIEAVRFFNIGSSQGFCIIPKMDKVQLRDCLNFSFRPKLAFLEPGYVNFSQNTAVFFKKFPGQNHKNAAFELKTTISQTVSKMNWKEYWNKVAEKSDPYQQVARIGGKGEMSALILEETAARIARILELKPSDHLLDVCCGNGLLTQMILPYCKQITGVDISEGQIALAKDLAKEEIDFKVADVTRLRSEIAGPFDHIVLYFSFQYLETPSKAIASIHQMSDLLKPGGRILLGDVPEREKLKIFYPKREDRLKYELKRRWGKSLMGRFWSLRELEVMAHPLGLSIKRIEQPRHFPYAHYRADFLLEKVD